MYAQAGLRFLGQASNYALAVSGPSLKVATARRSYIVLAIESSCDDSAIALLNRTETGCELLHHAKTGLDSSENGGIIPSLALEHHAMNIAPLADAALNRLESSGRPRKVDVVAATQGPGMFSSLLAGFQVAKGISSAFKVPLVGVHHMLGHLLMPRFFEQPPAFPLVSLLVSGGHTILVLSRSVTDHQILAETMDVAAGNALDKCARALGMKSSMMARELDSFTQPGMPAAELPPELAFALPLENKGDRSSQLAAFSFASYVSQLMQRPQPFSMVPVAQQPEAVRRALGIAVQESLFTHIVRKTELALSRLPADVLDSCSGHLPFVVSGGVASNSRLRLKLQHLKAPVPVKLHATPLQWCTDNALMIGWAGIEMYEAGITTLQTELPRARWPLPELAIHPSSPLVS